MIGWSNFGNAIYKVSNIIKTRMFLMVKYFLKSKGYSFFFEVIFASFILRWNILENLSPYIK
jgi:hypothetical protein